MSLISLPDEVLRLIVEHICTMPRFPIVLTNFSMTARRLHSEVSTAAFARAHAPHALMVAGGKWQVGLSEDAARDKGAACSSLRHLALLEDMAREGLLSTRGGDTARDACRGHFVCFEYASTHLTRRGHRALAALARVLARHKDAVVQVGRVLFFFHA